MCPLLKLAGRRNQGSGPARHRDDGSASLPHAARACQSLCEGRDIINNETHTFQLAFALLFLSDLLSYFPKEHHYY